MYIIFQTTFKLKELKDMINIFYIHTPTELTLIVKQQCKEWTPILFSLFQLISKVNYLSCCILMINFIIHNLLGWKLDISREINFNCTVYYVVYSVKGTQNEGSIELIY